MKGIIPYIRLLRLPDQYIQFGAALAAGLYTGEKTWWIFWWGIAGVSALAGLLLAAYVSLFWWAAAMLAVGLAYSLEPLRLKRRVLLGGLGVFRNNLRQCSAISTCLNQCPKQRPWCIWSGGA